MRGFTLFALLGTTIWLVSRPASAQDFGDLLDDIPLIDPFGVVDEAVEAVEREVNAESRRGRPPRATARPAEPKPPAPETLIEEADAALRAADSIRRELDPNLPAAPALPPKTPRLIPKTIHLAKVYGNDPSRYLALQLWLVNPTEEAVTIKREDLRLAVLGREIAPGPPPRQPALQAIRIGDRMRRLSDIPHKGEVTIAPQSVVEISIAFFDVPGAADVPAMTLKLPIGGATIEVDLNKLALGRMKPTIERIGPRDLLAVITMGGEINDVAAGGLVELLEQLVKADTTRVVLNWTDDAPAVPSDVMNWLMQNEIQRQFGRAANDGQHPGLPGGLVELSFVNLPDRTNYTRHGSANPVHDTLPEAVAATLAEPYRAIPLDALRREIAAGHPLTRPVAIAAGSRLPESDLPQLLALTRDADPIIAQAALSALGGFTTPEALARLIEIAKSGPEPLQAVAIESLAASRHGAAHEALGDLLNSTLNEGSTIPLETLSRILARYPRDLWRDALFELSLRAEPSDRRDVLVALARVGHPRLDESLAAAVASGDRILEMRALNLLIQQTDSHSEQLAIEYTLDYLRDNPPTPEMTALLERVKDPRAVPLLLAKVDEISNETMPLVQLLAKIGGEDARKRIEELYSSAPHGLRGQLLNLLDQINSPRALEFAEQALEEQNPALAHSALQIIKEDGSPAAVRTLSRLLKNTTDSGQIQRIASTLSEINTDTALSALRQAIHRGAPWSESAETYYAQALRRSPGFHACLQGIRAQKNREWEDAKRQYSTAIEFDPGLVEAWTGRGHAHMQLEDRAAAREDFTHALSIDPQLPAAVTCLAILNVVEGRVEEGLDDIEKRADEFRDNETFAYNAACVKALAAIPISKTDPARAERLQAEAVEDLERSFELGMDERDDVAWAREDPDLKSLHERDDFERVMNAAEKELGPRPKLGPPIPADPAPAVPANGPVPPALPAAPADE